MKKRYKLRTWVKVSLALIIGAIIGIAVYQMFTIQTVKSTPVGDYTCNGGIIEICGGSKEVSDYLGV